MNNELWLPLQTSQYTGTVCFNKYVFIWGMVVKLKLGNIVNVIGTHHGIELYLDRIIWL